MSVEPFSFFHNSMLILNVPSNDTFDTRKLNTFCVLTTTESSWGEFWLVILIYAQVASAAVRSMVVVLLFLVHVYCCPLCLCFFVFRLCFVVQF